MVLAPKDDTAGKDHFYRQNIIYRRRETSSPSSGRYLFRGITALSAFYFYYTLVV
jgi:hypothetical protein